ncbi:MAG: HNH endonuclease [Desulfovibrionaceae bacterium]|nr:HNH endonuclease [Desulfovibrionaceae bacterium]
MDHIDRNTSNNRASNLRWMSQQDNYRAYCEGVK